MSGICDQELVQPLLTKFDDYRSNDGGHVKNMKGKLRQLNV